MSLRRMQGRMASLSHKVVSTRGVMALGRLAPFDRAFVDLKVKMFGRWRRIVRVAAGDFGCLVISGSLVTLQLTVDYVLSTVTIGAKGVPFRKGGTARSMRYTSAPPMQGFFSI